MRWLLLCALVAVLFGPAGRARGDDIRQAIEGAWSRSAEIEALTARRAEIIARRRAAGRVTPGPPVVGIGHLNDYATGDDGYREYDVELATPLWLPGEGTAARRVADAELVQLDAELAAARLSVAGAVVDAYWRYRLAAAAALVARRRLDAARQLQSDIDRQQRAGEVSRAVLLLAVADTADAGSRLSADEASLTEARLAFQALTGAEPPADHAEPEAAAAGDDPHPRQIALRRAVEVTEANARLLERQDRDNPELALLGVVEREFAGDPYDTRIGVRVVIPFATDGRNQPRRQANAAARIRALAELRAADDAIAAERSKAAADLASAEDRQTLAADRYQALAERLELIERSVRFGEGAFVELLRARASLYEADTLRLQSRIQVMQARSRLNQALGQDPWSPAATTAAGRRHRP